MVEQNDSAEPDFGATFALAAGAYEPEAEPQEAQEPAATETIVPPAACKEVIAAESTALEEKASETQQTALPDATKPQAIVQETPAQEIAVREPAMAAASAQEVPEFAVPAPTEPVIASSEAIAPELSAPETKISNRPLQEASVFEVVATPAARAPELTLEAIAAELNASPGSDTTSAESEIREVAPLRLEDLISEPQAIVPPAAKVVPQAEVLVPRLEAVAPQTSETPTSPVAAREDRSSQPAAAAEPETAAQPTKVNARQWTMPADAAAKAMSATAAASKSASTKVDNGKVATRPFRVKLRGSVLVLVRLPNRRDVRAAIHQLSTSGGVIHLEKPLDEKIVVEMIFHIGGTTVREKAQMLFPMWATQGWMQPFRFTNLSEADRIALDGHLKGFLGEAAKGAAAGS